MGECRVEARKKYYRSRQYYNSYSTTNRRRQVVYTIVPGDDPHDTTAKRRSFFFFFLLPCALLSRSFFSSGGIVLSQSSRAAAVAGRCAPADNCPSQPSLPVGTFTQRRLDHHFYFSMFCKHCRHCMNHCVCACVPLLCTNVCTTGFAFAFAATMSLPVQLFAVSLTHCTSTSLTHSLHFNFALTEPSTVHVPQSNDVDFSAGFTHYLLAVKDISDDHVLVS